MFPVFLQKDRQTTRAMCDTRPRKNGFRIERIKPIQRTRRRHRVRRPRALSQSRFPHADRHHCNGAGSAAHEQGRFRRKRPRGTARSPTPGRQAHGPRRRLATAGGGHGAVRGLTGCEGPPCESLRSGARRMPNRLREGFPCRHRRCSLQASTRASRVRPPSADRSRDRTGCGSPWP